MVAGRIRVAQLVAWGRVGVVTLIAVFAFSAAGASCAANGVVGFFPTIPEDQEGGGGDES